MGRTDLNISNNQCLELPVDLVEEVLERLPTKSLAKFLVVSKSWKTIICSRDFIRSFSLRFASSCILLAYTQKDYLTERVNWFFFSTGINQDVPDLNSRMSIHVSELHETYQYAHALMMLEYGQDHVIINPSISKSITLPRLITSRKFKQMFLGYDPVGGLYKVLCICKTPSEYQILTLGPSKWRNIEFGNPHDPLYVSKGRCIDGVLYYLAYMENNVGGRLSLARFEVRSEKLSFVTTTVSKDFYLPYLVHYMAKIAIAKQTSWNTFDLWVLEDAKKDEWCKVCLSIHHRNNMVDINSYLRVVGTAHTGEIILTCYDKHGQLHLIYQDHKNKGQIIQKEINLPVIANYSVRGFRTPLCVVDHTESVMML